MTYKAACTILNIGFCLNLLVAETLLVVVVNLVVDGIAVAVVDCAVILVVIGSVVVVLAGEKDYRNEAKQSGRWE